MHRSGLAFLVLTSLSALCIAGCGKKDDDKPAAPTTPQAPQQQAVVPPTGPGDPAGLREACKKTFATSCALPCERRVEASEKDPTRLKTALNTCMRVCLEQAEVACRQAGAIH